MIETSAPGDAKGARAELAEAKAWGGLSCTTSQTSDTRNAAAPENEPGHTSPILKRGL